jgi:Tol biopolymer transport system component
VSRRLAARIGLLGIVLWATSCSDGPAAFELGNQFPEPNGAALRLTYNPNDDRTPAWSPGGDSVYYAAESFLPFAATNGVLLAAPRAGGVVSPIFQQGELARPTWIAPAPSADGESIAFFELQEFWRYDCAVVRDPQFPESLPDLVQALPLLKRAALRIRDLDRTAADAAALTVEFGGRTFDTTRHPFNLAGVVVIEGALFQREYGKRSSPLFRASWSPDGQRVVFSDGKRLLIWTIGTAAAVPVPNTEDGVWPAWSPDGQWIAFTRLVRGPESTLELHCINAHGAVIEVYDIRQYNTSSGTAPSRIELIQPDGASLRSLGIGEAPAWAGSTELVFARAGNLWRSNIQGTSQVLIANTADGTEPAVSPDRAWVAFTKPTSAGSTKRDVWVAPF